MMKKDYTIKMNCLMCLMMIASTMVVIQIARRELFLLMQILFCAIMLIYKKNIIFFEHKMINFLFITVGLSAVSACVEELPYSYQKAAVVMTIFLIPLYFALSYIYDLLKKDHQVLRVIIKGFKITCMIQLLWIPLQYVLYHFIGLDINKVLFVDLFHFVENATFIRDWSYYPSGLTWHSAVLAPMFVLAIVLFKNPLIRALVVFDAIICGNSTSLIGVCICIALLFFFYLKKNIIRIRLSKVQLVILGILGVVALMIMVRFGIVNMIWERIMYLYMRLFGEQQDASTAAHFSYFTDYFKVLPNSSPLQIIFGYGYGCSGYPISVMYDRYTELGNWAIECDIINILMSRGIAGFLAHYALLFYVCIKGIKIDYRYPAVMIPIIIQGIGYNVQWDYVLFMEILMFLTIKMRINFFESVAEDRSVWIKTDEMVEAIDKQEGLV